MSIESAKAFFERLKNDEEWRNKVNAAEGKQERLAMVQGEGFDFTEEEWETVSSELPLDDLQRVAGGRKCSWEPDACCVTAGVNGEDMGDM